MGVYAVSIDDLKYSVAVTSNAEAVVNGMKAEVLWLHGPVYSVLLDGVSVRVVATGDKHKYDVLADGILLEVMVESERSRLLRSLSQTAGPIGRSLEVRAPMPALVLRIEVHAGDEVVAGQGLIVLEAMKMENELKAVHGGKVKELLVTHGTPVDKGQLLMLLE